ncbi:hypothetical protein ACWEQ4_00870 [Rhodococcus sp. NPDC003994]
MTPRPVVLAADHADGAVHYRAHRDIPLNALVVTRHDQLLGITVDSIHTTERFWATAGAQQLHDAATRRKTTP